MIRVCERTNSLRMASGVKARLLRAGPGPEITNQGTSSNNITIEQDRRIREEPGARERQAALNLIFLVFSVDS